MDGHHEHAIIAQEQSSTSSLHGAGLAGRRLAPSRELPRELSFCEIATDDGDLLVIGFRNANDARPSALSTSERVVVALALEGLSNLEIGEARATSARTVANQLASAFRKLGVSSRRELASAIPLGAGW